jgi:5-methylcytosine-specific restriction enzyme A
MRYCLQPGCGAIVPRGYCAGHRRKMEARRGSSNSRGYTRTWSKRSKRFLDRFPLCGMRPGNLAPVMSRCHSDGVRTPADVVDHVVPHRGNVDLFDDELNWQALCYRCHARKSQTEMTGDPRDPRDRRDARTGGA